MERMLTVREVARYLRISKTEAYKLIRTKRLKAYKLTPESTRSEWRIKREDIQNYLEGKTNVSV